MSVIRPFTVVIIKCLAENSTIVWVGSSFHVVLAPVSGAVCTAAVIFSSPSGRGRSFSWLQQGLANTGLTNDMLVYLGKLLVSSAQNRRFIPMAEDHPTSTVCSRFHRAIELIGSRWTGAILQTLLQGRTRYAAIKTAIPDITDRMLSERLRSLEAEGL